MILRILAVLALLYGIGFAIFLKTMPAPVAGPKTDAIVVLTGGAGRIDRGLALLKAHAGQRMLISGVAPEVRPGELAHEYRVSPSLFRCCIDLGHEAVDTRSNADETADWVRDHKYTSVRLVTSDWHLARAKLELVSALDGDASVIGDGVPSTPRYALLVGEYNKLLVRRAALLMKAVL
ncbi:YdcF family protein [Sphingomonas glacialis]|uniref:YdcF family protein n=1 Tax=Sphingomonas glacialis TaxID=658225 RepID=A0A502FT47_9SPHN|nr:YdcF family protein [Sphingomonas glacialis]TPG52708.1 YdcF family protein [Sphingomonas glacialis]